MKNIEFPKISEHYYFKFHENDESGFPLWYYRGGLFLHYDFDTKELIPIRPGVVMCEICPKI